MKATRKIITSAGIERVLPSPYGRLAAFVTDDVAPDDDGMSTTTNLPPAGSFTMMGWFFLTADTNDFRTYISFGDAAGGFQCKIQTRTTGIDLNLYNGTVDTNAGTMALNTWTHLALAGNLTGTVNAYKNNMSQASATGNASNSAEKL